jgi:hypothetical protein
MDWSGALGDAHDLGDGLDVVQAVDLVAREGEHRHAREGVHDAAIARQEGKCGVAAVAALRACLAAGEDEAGGHALDVPLERAADGLVEVVNVEEEVTVGRGEGAEVADVRVAAELGEDAGVLAEREIVGHDGHGAAEEAEG